FAEDLRRVRDDRSILARRHTPVEQLRRWARRNPLLAALAIAVQLLALTVVVVSIVAAVYWQHERDRAVSAQRDSARQLTNSLIAQARALRSSRRPGQRFEALARIEQAVKMGHGLNLPADWFAVARTEAIGALALPDLYASETIDIGQEPNVAAVDSDLSRFAFLTPDGVGHVREYRDGAELYEL